MVEGGLTYVSNDIVGARWIVLTPSADDAGWRDALAQAASSAGLRLITGEREHWEHSVTDPNCVILVADAAWVTSAVSDHVAVLIPKPTSCAMACAATYGLAAPDALRHASNLLANATARASAGRFFPPASLEGDQPIALFDGLIVSPPRVGALVTGDAAAKAAGEALAIYQGGVPQTGAAATWDPILFAYAKNIDAAPAETTFDVTGRPRTLVYGPYVTLPPGRWQATIRFAIDDDAAMRRFRLDWGADADYAMLLVRPPYSGIYELSLEHEFQTGGGAQIRILLMEGAFSGALTFHGGVVTRLRDDAAVEPLEMAS